MPMPPLPELSCKYGAPMGRLEYDDHPTDAALKFYLQYVPFIDGCYDRGGAYWGAPANLFTAYSRDQEDDLTTRLFIRANSRDDAKRQILERYPNATFYR